MPKRGKQPPKKPFWLVRKLRGYKVILAECVTAEAAKRVQREYRRWPTRIVRAK